MRGRTILLISSGPAPSTRASSTVLTMLSAHGDGWGQSSQAHSLRAIDDFFPKCLTIEKGIVSVFRTSFERTLLSLMSKGLRDYSSHQCPCLKANLLEIQFQHISLGSTEGDSSSREFPPLRQQEGVLVSTRQASSY